MTGPLNVFAQLSILGGNGEEISVSAKDEIITIDFASFWVGRSILKSQFSNRNKRETMLQRLQNGLQYADLALEFRVARRVIARLSPQSRPNWLSRWLGYGPLELKLWPILLSLFHR
jgi:hypothetical protein